MTADTAAAVIALIFGVFMFVGYFDLHMPFVRAWWVSAATLRGWWTTVTVAYKRWRTPRVRRQGENYVHSCELGLGADLSQYYRTKHRWGDPGLQRKFEKSKKKWEQTRAACRQCRMNEFLKAEATRYDEALERGRR